MGKKKNKYSRVNLQQKCLGIVNKLESKVRSIRRKIQDGHYGFGNNFDIETFASDMDEIGETELEFEWVGEDQQ